MNNNLEKINGALWDLEDDVNCLIEVLKSLERTYEVEENFECRCRTKSFILISERLSEKISIIASELDIWLTSRKPNKKMSHDKQFYIMA